MRQGSVPKAPQPLHPPPLLNALSALWNSPFSGAGRALHRLGRWYMKVSETQRLEPPDSDPAFSTYCCVTHTRDSTSLCFTCAMNGNNKTTDDIGSHEPKMKYSLSTHDVLRSVGSNLSSATFWLCNLEQITYPLSASVSSSMKWG